MKKPLLIFFVLLMLGAMFMLNEHPEYNPFNAAEPATEVATTGDVIKDETVKADQHQGEE
jgi:hypothetical protein